VDVSLIGIAKDAEYTPGRPTAGVVEATCWDAVTTFEKEPDIIVTAKQLLPDKSVNAEPDTIFAGRPRWKLFRKTDPETSKKNPRW